MRSFIHIKEKLKTSQLRNIKIRIRILILNKTTIPEHQMVYLKLVMIVLDQ